MQNCHEKSRLEYLENSNDPHQDCLDTTVLTFSTVLCLHLQTAACCLCWLLSGMAARRILNEISPILQHDIMPSTHCHNMIAIVAISRRLRRGRSKTRLHVAPRFRAVAACCFFVLFCCLFFFTLDIFFIHSIDM